MENPYKNGWFGGTTIFGNTHIWFLHSMNSWLVKWQDFFVRKPGHTMASSSGIRCDLQRGCNIPGYTLLLLGWFVGFTGVMSIRTSGAPSSLNFPDQITIITIIPKPEWRIVKGICCGEDFLCIHSLSLVIALLSRLVPAIILLVLLIALHFIAGTAKGFLA